MNYDTITPVIAFLLVLPTCSIVFFLFARYISRKQRVEQVDTVPTKPKPQKPIVVTTNKTSPSWLGWALAVPFVGLALWGATALVSSTWHSYAEIEKTRSERRSIVNNTPTTKPLSTQTRDYYVPSGSWGYVQIPPGWTKWNWKTPGSVIICDENGKILYDSRSGGDGQLGLILTGGLWVTSITNTSTTITFTRK